MNFYSYNPVEVFFGRNCIADHPEVFRRYGQRALIVTGRSSSGNGSLADVTQVLASCGIAWDVFDGTRPNPTVASVRAGAAMARTCGSDFIIGIGGGSPMDTAKGNALVLPAYMEFVARTKPDVVANILDAMKLSSMEEFREIFDELLGETDLLTEDEILAFTATVMKKKNVPNCLVVPDRDDVEGMLRHMAGRRSCL